MLSELIYTASGGVAPIDITDRADGPVDKVNVASNGTISFSVTKKPRYVISTFGYNGDRAVGTFFYDVENDKILSITKNAGSSNFSYSVPSSNGMFTVTNSTVTVKNTFGNARAVAASAFY